MTMLEKQLIVDIRKAIFAELYYVNQVGTTRPTKPKGPTLNGHKIYKKDLVYLSNPPETVYKKALRLGNLDVWTAILHIQFNSHNHKIIKGPNALKLYRSYQKSVLNK